MGLKAKPEIGPMTATELIERLREPACPTCLVRVLDDDTGQHYMSNPATKLYRCPRCGHEAVAE